MRRLCTTPKLQPWIQASSWLRECAHTTTPMPCCSCCWLLQACLIAACVLQYMHYTRPAHMTLTMLDGANRQPALPTSEAEGGTSAANTPADTPRGRQQHQLASPRPPASPAAASCTIIEEHPEGDADRAGVIADSAPSVGIGALVSSLSKRSLGASPGSRGRGLALSAPGVQYDLEADEAQRLAQRALRTLQSQKASLKERGSWPGGEEAGWWPCVWVWRLLGVGC